MVPGMRFHVFEFAVYKKPFFSAPHRGSLYQKCIVTGTLGHGTEVVMISRPPRTKDHSSPECGRCLFQVDFGPGLRYTPKSNPIL
eukprot:475781-Rhodomonas_salina.1